MSNAPTPEDHHEVLHPDAISSGHMEPEAATDGDDSPEMGEVQEAATGDIESPGKVIRIGAMVKQLLEELRNIDLDEASRDRLRDLYASSITELKEGLSPELGEELDRLSFDFSREDLPSGAELQLAQAQLVGWLEGVFHGIQAALMAQQMSMRQQLEGMRGQLPEHTGGPGGTPGPGPGYL